MNKTKKSFTVIFSASLYGGGKIEQKTDLLMTEKQFENYIKNLPYGINIKAIIR